MFCEIRVCQVERAGIKCIVTLGGVHFGLKSCTALFAHKNCTLFLCNSINLYFQKLINFTKNKFINITKFSSRYKFSSFRNDCTKGIECVHMLFNRERSKHFYNHSKFDKICCREIYSCVAIHRKFSICRFFSRLLNQNIKIKAYQLIQILTCRLYRVFFFKCSL